MPRRVQDARFNTAAFTQDRLDLQGLRHGPHPLDSMGCALTASDADLYGPDAGVARHASSKFARNRNYVALHLRGGDGEFRRRFHQTVRNAFKEVDYVVPRAAEEGDRAPKYYPCLYMSRRTRPIKSSREFREGLARLAAVVRKESNGASGEAISVSYLRKVIPDAQKAVVAASKTPQNGRLLAHAPDLDMHLDLLICAHALLGFGGTAGSSVSSSIRTLRKYRMMRGGLL